MNTLRLGITGGCLNTGNGLIPLSAVYHRVLAKRVESECGVKLRIHLGSLETPDRAAHLEAVRDLLDRRKPDRFIYQIRPEFLWLLSTQLWKRRDQAGLASIGFNSLSHSESKCSVKEPGVRPIGRLRRLNWQLARLSGAHAKGWRCLRELLFEIEELCRQRSTRLALLGPIFGPWYLDAFQESAERSLQAIAADLDVRYVELRRPLTEDEHTESLWFEDGCHLNAAGHRTTADVVFPLIKDWAIRNREAPP